MRMVKEWGYKMAEASAWVMIPKTINKGKSVVIDMEILVLCKDCKFGEKAKNGFKEDVIECTNSDLGMMGDCHPLDWFCADGERKGD